MADLFSKLGVDWKLLLAQAVNFLIVLWVLHRFVFKKILHFMDARKASIEKGIALREQAERELKRIDEARRRDLEAVRQKTDKEIARAKELGKEKEREIVLAARQAAENMLAKTKVVAARQKEDKVKEAEEEIKRRSLFLAEKVLERSITKKDQERFVKEVVASFAKAHD